jgi:DNA-binding NarL/FixJ family response regulator
MTTQSAAVMPNVLAYTAATNTAIPSEGFLLLNFSYHPIFANSAATEILSYPQKPCVQKDLAVFLNSKVRSTLLSGQSSRASGVVSRFKSGRRVYQCRAYRVNSLASGEFQASVAVILERSSNGTSSLSQVSERFHLTPREQEVVQYLVEGLTTKEIAVRLQISPNTVKAFLHSVMIKMGVSTRSGVVGKALTPRL